MKTGIENSRQEFPKCLSAHDAVQTRTGAGRRSGAYFGMFAAAVCVQVMCWVFGPAQKLPPTVAEAGAKSFACLRAVGCAHGRVWVFQTVLGGRRL